jgi:hypothetical protein
MHSWSTFGARTNHEQTWTHRIHHGPDLKEATTFFFIIFFVRGHGAYIQMSFCFETPTPKMGAHLKVCEFILSHFLTLLGT